MIRETNIFERTEIKYGLDYDQYKLLTGSLGERIVPDEYGRSTVSSLYFDTDSFRLIRQSQDSGGYKEKLRLRSYGTPDRGSRVFLEIKKKYEGIVYKRRVSMSYEQAMDYISERKKPFCSQIMREIDYFMDFYGNPYPRALVAYEREAYFLPEYPELRITFDSDIRYRTDHLSLAEGSAGRSILPEGRVLMEIKSPGYMPLFLAELLDNMKIYPTSFSKYGTAYSDIGLQAKESGAAIINKGGALYA